MSNIRNKFSLMLKSNQNSQLYVKNKERLIERLLKSYSKNIGLRTLIQLLAYGGIGYGSALDVAVTTTYENMKEERLRAFFDELENGKIELTPDLVNSEDFLHKFFITTKAALNTHRREKIKLFAYLLLSSEEKLNFSSIDEYEEYLEALDEITLRELYILVVLDKYVQKYPRKKMENILQGVMNFWDEFTKEVTDKLQISSDEFNAILTRLNRTGLYQTIVGGFMNYGGDRGNLTPIYYKLKKLIRLDIEVNIF